MSPLGKDIHFTALMGSTQFSLSPAGPWFESWGGGGWFSIRLQLVFTSSVLGGGKRAPAGALIHSKGTPGLCSTRDISASVTKANTRSQTLFVTF